METENTEQQQHNNNKDGSVTTSSKYTLTRENVDPRFREPFIMKGYREPNMNVIDCLKSVLCHECNETINVWSHFLAFIYFAIKFIHVFTNELSIADPFAWPLLCYAIGILAFCITSSIAHTFNSVSLLTRNACFCLDYAAISIFSVGAGQAFFFYSRPLNPTAYIFKSTFIFSIVSIVTSLGSTIKCCLTRRGHVALKYLFRTLSYALPFFVNSSPFLYRLLFGSHIDSFTDEVLLLFLVHALCFIAGAIVNVTRLPECYTPGVFDTFGQSHNWMHIFTAVGASLQFDAVKLDMFNRREFLQNQFMQVETQYSLVYLMIGIVLNVLFGFGLGVTTPVQRIVDKVDKKKE